MKFDYVCDQCGQVLIWLKKGKCPKCGGEAVKKMVRSQSSSQSLFSGERSVQA
jgi:rRNA maturation endonuclease Nob1